MSKFHLSDNGPAVCKATIRACPVGGEHFESERDAEEAFKNKNNFNTFEKENKKIKKLGSVSSVEYDDWRKLSKRKYDAAGELQEKLNEKRSFERYEESTAGILKKFLKNKEFERDIPELEEKYKIATDNLKNYEKELVNSRKNSEDDPIVLTLQQNGVVLERKGTIENHITPKTPEAEEIVKLGESINPAYKDFPIGDGGGNTDFAWSMKNAGVAAFERTHVKLLNEGVWDKGETEDYIKELRKLYSPNVTDSIVRFHNGELHELIANAKDAVDRAERLGK